MKDEKDDFLGGLFDFNGDGKTDCGEMFIAYKIFEDVTKDESDSDDKNSYASGNSSSLFSGSRSSIFTSTVPDYSNAKVPKAMTPELYKAIRSNFILDCVSSIIGSLLLCFLPGVLIWAAIAAYDPKNSEVLPFTVLLVIGGLIAIGLILKSGYTKISNSYAYLEKAKKNLPEGNDSDNNGHD